MNNIILCGGGTAGHITPAISIYDFFKKKGYNPKLVIAKRDISLIPKEYSYEALSISSPGNIKKNILFIINFLPAIISAYKIIKNTKPKCVIGMGGFISMPILYVAKIFQIPIFLCEQNSIPGKVNKIFYKSAKSTYLTFDKTLEFFPNGKVFGNPVRKEFFSTNREEARKKMSLNDNDKLLVVMGGSQGALKINQLFLESIEDIKKEINNLHIVWLTGNSWADSIIEKTKGIDNLTVHSFYTDMPTILYAADFIVSRAGSSSISEIIAVNTPSLLIPFPYATDNHQYYNALDLFNKDIAYLVEEKDLNKNTLTTIIVNNIKNNSRLNDIRNNISNNNKIYATELISNDILKNI